MEPAEAGQLEVGAGQVEYTFAAEMEAVMAAELEELEELEELGVESKASFLL